MSMCDRGLTVGFKNCATGHDQGFHRGGQAIASYSLIRPPSTGVRLIWCAGSGMTLGSSAGARRFGARWALPVLCEGVHHGRHLNQLLVLRQGVRGSASSAPQAELD